MAREFRRELPEGATLVAPTVQAAYDAQMRSLHRKLLELAAADADFRERLIEDPRAALESAGLAAEFDELTDPSQAEVAGHSWSHWWRRCVNYSGEVDYAHDT